MAEGAVRVTPLKAALAGIQLAAYAVGILALSGDWRWVEGWIFSGWLVAISVAIVGHLYFKDPALLAERFRRPGTGGEVGWDRYLVWLLMIQSLAWFVVMPLDRRFGWSPALPLAVEVFGGALLVPASYFIFRALADNTFASALVRIQTERHHRVVSTGVYGFVRHPMYLGAFCMLAGAPLLLGSVWGLAIGIAGAAAIAARIVGEERLLVERLPGYREYRQKVRYRLIPRVW